MLMVWRDRMGSTSSKRIPHGPRDCDHRATACPAAFADGVGALRSAMFGVRCRHAATSQVVRGIRVEGVTLAIADEPRQRELLGHSMRQHQRRPAA